ncbi:MAG: methyltransferase domain-containing protein [candidate division Zixibacteria bacterium]|nr:methyltransferase domain-containing protein [candidate division Zixibacteria bacterium]
MSDGNQFDYYSQAEAYDTAFGFRDLDFECDTLDALCEQFRGAKPRSFADLGCGPAYHGIHYATRGLRTYGLDINPHMIEYARAKAKRFGTKVEFVQGDMREFDLPEPADLAMCAIATIHYLLTNEDMITHLRSVARNLTDGGIYVFEANHPRDVFNIARSAKNEWEFEGRDISVITSWGVDEQFDPITQLATSTIHMEVKRGTDTQTYDFENLDRCHTHQELKLLIEQSGVFEPMTWLGALDVKQPLDNSKESWRMIPVLRKR